MASLRSFSPKQIEDHIRAANALGLIKDEVASYISENGSKLYEADVLKFVKSAYKRHKLVNDHKKEFAICAFGVNTSQVHYFPKGKGLKLKPNTLILLDIWGRLRSKGATASQSPYADMTWMFWFGPKKIPEDIQKKWNVLKQSRGATILEIQKYLKKGKMPRGLDIDRVAHDVIGAAEYGGAIKHTVGHSLGFDSPHGKLPGINWKEYSSLLKNVGYTIEPGMYFKTFGMRTEIDFYVTKNNKVVITTPVQKEITRISYPS